MKAHYGHCCSFHSFCSWKRMKKKKEKRKEKIKKWARIIFSTKQKESSKSAQTTNVQWSSSIVSKDHLSTGTRVLCQLFYVTDHCHIYNATIHCNFNFAKHARNECMHTQRTSEWVMNPFKPRFKLVVFRLWIVYCECSLRKMYVISVIWWKTNQTGWQSNNRLKHCVTDRRNVLAALSLEPNEEIIAIYVFNANGRAAN